MKHFNSFRTLLTVCLLALTAQLNAADTLIDGLYYILHADEHTASLSGLADKTIASLEIPSTVESDGISYNVTRVENYALSNCSSLQSLSVPGTIVSMNTTLDGCTALKELTLQDGNLPLEMYSTFATEKLEKLYLGRNLATYINIPFSNSKEALSSLTIGPQVTELPDDLFSGCSNLTVVELPHVKTIGSGCFQDCPRLTTLSLGDSLDSVGHAAFSNCTNLTNLAFPSTIKTIGGNAFSGCSNITSVSFPSECDLTTIGSSTFRDCVALTAFKCPESVASIGQYAFYNCKKLVTIVLGKALKSIEEYTFYGDAALSDMTIPEGVTRIKNFAFYNCTGIATYSLPSTLDSIDSYVFCNDSALVRLTIPGNVSSIYSDCFGGCTHLSYLTFQDGDNGIVVRSSFTDCPLTRLYLGRNLFESDFRNQTKLRRVTFSEKVSYFNNYLFYGCTAITSLNLPDSLATVGAYAFAGCTGLTELSFPGVIESIGQQCFNDCSRLASVTFEDGNGTCAENGFFWSSPLQKVYIGKNLTYDTQTFQPGQSDTQWYSPFYNAKTLADVSFSQSGTVTSLHNHLLDGCSSVMELSLPQSLVTIGSYAFNAMSRLQSIKVYDNVTTIGEYCFANDTCLVSATLSENITELASHLFYNCAVLDNFTIPSNVVKVDESAFESCNALSSIAFSENVTDIENNAFADCASLKNITFADGTGALNIGYLGASKDDARGMFRDSPVETLYLGRNLIYSGDGIQYSPFAYATTLNSLTLGTKLTNIAKYAFEGCTALPKVSMPDNITSVGQEAFKGDTSLGNLSLSNNLASVGEQSFMNCKSLAKVVLPASLDALSSKTFAGCSVLTDVDLGNTLNTIGPSAFQDCKSLENIEIPKSVYGFGVEAFSGCTALKSINLTEGIKSIGKLSFSGCTALASVVMSANLVSIGDEAFTGCTSLMNIHSFAEIPPEGLANFPDTVKNYATLHVPEGSLEDYKDSPTWEDFFHIVEFDTTGIDAIATEGTTNDDKEAFDYWFTLQGVKLDTKPAKAGIYIHGGKKIVIQR